MLTELYRPIFAKPDPDHPLQQAAKALTNRLERRSVFAGTFSLRQNSMTIGAIPGINPIGEDP